MNQKEASKHIVPIMAMAAAAQLNRLLGVRFHARSEHGMVRISDGIRQKEWSFMLMLKIETKQDSTSEQEVDYFVASVADLQQVRNGVVKHENIVDYFLPGIAEEIPIVIHRMFNKYNRLP